jgi:hypothetical protein
MSRSLRALVLLVACSVCLGSCGGPGTADATSTITIGPLTFSLPLLPSVTGETLLFGFKNLKPFTATVFVTAFTPAGVAYGPGTVPVVIPALGEFRSPQALFTGGATPTGGWVLVETRDVTVLHPVTGEPTPTATSGFVVPYAKRFTTAREDDAIAGEAFRDTTSLVALVEEAFAYQVVNHSVLPMAGGSVPVAADFVVTEYDEFGAIVTSASFLIPANGAITFAPVIGVGQVSVVPTAPPGQTAPVGTVFQAAAASIEADPQVQIEARLLEATDTTLGIRSVGFDLRFGIDTPGNVYDFALNVTNRGTTRATIVIEEIRDAAGGPILTLPRAVGLDPKATKFLRTTTIDSRGLELGEVSPFADLFGPVGVTTGVTRFWIRLGIPTEVDVSARELDTIFKVWRRILPGRKQTNDMAVTGIETVTTLPSGIRNYMTFTNPQVSSVRIQVRATTPGGTEYLLDPIDVASGTLFEWSPDGLLFTEDPSDPLAPPVPFVAYRFTPSGGLFFGARKERRDNIDLIVTVTPHPLRDLFFE